MSNKTHKTVLIAGASGYAGRHIVTEYKRKHPDWTIKALVRRETKFEDGIEVVIGEATKPETLHFEAVDIVVSALGITRQRDGLTYKDVDYQANMNLLNEAISKGVGRFGYIHVLKGDVLAEMGVVGVQAKQDFVDALLKEKERISPTVMCPSGFFSDMKDFLDMAKGGRIYLFGDGQHKINPIHGADLASATVDAIDKRVEQKNVGGPDVFTHVELSRLALQCINPEEDATKKISFIWDGIRKFILAIIPWVTPMSVYGPAQLFLSSMDMDMVGDCVGTHHLKDSWTETITSHDQERK